MSPSDLWEVCIKSAAGGTQCAYMHIPADVLRNTVDGLFPSLAKNAVADAVSGFGHRWVHGHDLIMDIIGQFFRLPSSCGQTSGAYPPDRFPHQGRDSHSRFFTIRFGFPAG